MKGGKNMIYLYGCGHYTNDEVESDEPFLFVKGFCDKCCKSIKEMPITIIPAPITTFTQEQIETIRDIAAGVYTKLKG